MSRSPKKADTFVEQCLKGQALPQDIDDYVDRWHDGGDNRTLPEFLGFSPQEYALWVERPNALRMILFAKRHRRPIEEVLDEAANMRAAARAASPDEAREVLRWLKKTGRLKA